MRLISCYIENFGGLSHYALDFDQELTVIQAPNGFGKTTLAEFLRAMFYGFPRKAKTLEKSRRQKYAPWGGGKCGGSLVFEHEGVRYRLERTFGETPRTDSFRLIDLETGRSASRFSEEIGLELFQLDADSFERSTYLPQLHDGGTLTTAGIQAKLTRLVEDSGDMGNYDRAMTALKNKRSAYVPYRGSGGAVAEAASQISRVQRELDRASEQESELQRCTARIGELEMQCAALRNRIDRTRKQWEQASQAAAERARYDDLTARYAAAAEELRILRGKYLLGIPREEDIDEVWQTADVLAAREAAGLSDAERHQYEQLRQIFGSGGPDEEMLDALAEENRQLLQQRAVLDSMEKPSGHTAPKYISVRLISGMAAAAAGIVLLVLRRFLPGIILLAAGLAALAAARSGNRRSPVDALIRNEKYAAQEQRVRELEEKLRSVLGNGADFDKEISALRLALGQYRSLCEKQSALEIQTQDLNRKLDEFFARFALARNADVRRQLQQIWDDGKQQRSAAQRERQLAAQLAQFPPQPESADPESLKQMQRRLEERFHALMEELLSRRQEQRQLQVCADRIPELSDELEHWQARKTADQRKARLLDDTMDFLQKSRESLTTSYLGPIRERFDRYLTRLTGQREETFISSDLDVRLERQGQARELAYFSAGQTDTVMLCMRLALVDALFTEAKPFVILDDPFVNLDDERILEALKLLKELSREQQIIYLTCSKGRIL